MPVPLPVCVTVVLDNSKCSAVCLSSLHARNETLLLPVSITCSIAHLSRCLLPAICIKAQLFEILLGHQVSAEQT